MSIFPLPQFEADLEEDRKIYEALKAPKSMVVRFGSMRMLGEYPYDGQAKPGCGSKLVARTHRGTEVVEMLTTTCPNSGCGKSVSRGEMLQYFENSGGKDYPFHTDGRILRVATVEDMNAMAALESKKTGWLHEARRVQESVVKSGAGAGVGGLAGLEKVKVVEVEPLLGNERLIVHFLSEERVDFRPLVMELASLWHARVEMHQVGARDEARLTADYERCGQHCCCRQFLKVLKPVSMKSAKTQKATLDPLKISGRCGRLMCCLRYEDTTYDELKKNLPKKKTPIMTPDGPGIVIDTQILTQLVLVRLDATNEDAAYPIENLSKTMTPIAPTAGAASDDDDAADGPAAPSGDAPAASAAPAAPKQAPRPDQGGGGGGGGGGRSRDGGGRDGGRPQGGGGGGGNQPRGGGPQGGQRGGGGGGGRNDGRPPQGGGQRGGGGGGGGGDRGGQPRNQQGGRPQGDQRGNPQGGSRPDQRNDQRNDQRGGPQNNQRRDDRGRPPQQNQQQGQQNQQSGQPPNQPQGQERRPLTEEEKARKQMQRVIPKSDFRADGFHEPIDRTKPPQGQQPPQDSQQPPSPPAPQE